MMICIFIGMRTMAYADAKHNEARGQLLYATHCNSCHTSQIHWREQKLVTDWDSLVAQVRRWQYIGGLSWSEDEIIDVSHHLDKLYYGYKNTLQGRKPLQLMRKMQRPAQQRQIKYPTKIKEPHYANQ